MSTNDIDLSQYNPMDREVQQNPFPFYSALRERSPVHQLPGTNLYCVSRLSTVCEVLADTRTFSSKAANAGTLPDDGGVMAQLKEILAQGVPQVDTMLTQDPPLQTRYRKTVGKALSSRRVLELEPRIRQIADALIDAWPEDGRVDFMNQFAVPFPVRVIASMLEAYLPRSQRKEDDADA